MGRASAPGYIGRDHPEAVSKLDILADFGIGLSFDELEAEEKLAKVLESVALGNPNRLPHQVRSLADHLDDEELVRYRLCTALVAVGSEHPTKLSDGCASLVV